VAGNWYAPKGGWGAGGGGALQFYSYNVAYGGQGGNGFVMIESMRL
jgi:hypothetical protein